MPTAWDIVVDPAIRYSDAYSPENREYVEQVKRRRRLYYGANVEAKEEPAEDEGGARQPTGH